MTSTAKLILELRVKRGLSWENVVKVAMQLARINRELAEKLVQKVRGF